MSAAWHTLECSARNGFPETLPPGAGTTAVRMRKAYLKQEEMRRADALPSRTRHGEYTYRLRWDIFPRATASAAPPRAFTSVGFCA